MMRTRPGHRQGGRFIRPADARPYLGIFDLFNDASVRDVQMRTPPQWTMGKNFDGTGAFGPSLVTADELPLGCKGLGIRTRLDGEVVQEAVIDDMVFDIVQLIVGLSEVMTLKPRRCGCDGDAIGCWHGTYSKSLWMKAGGLCEVEIDGLGVLRNPVVDAKA